MAKMKVGLLGSGDITARVSRAFKNLPDDIEMYAVASRTYANAQKFAEEFGYEKVYETYEELMDDPEVDLIYIGLPHPQHYEYAKKALSRRKPVLCEKPFTINRFQAEEIIKAYEAEGVFLQEALWTRFLPVKQAIDKAIADGMIGEVKMADANMIICNHFIPRMHIPEMGGGALLDLGVYALNFVTMFLGSDIRELKSLGSLFPTGVDETEAFMMQYPEGRIGVCKVSMLTSGPVNGMIYGTEGHIEVSDVMNFERAKVYNQKGEVIVEYALRDDYNGYEYEFLACKRAIEEGRLMCDEMPHEDTLFLMETYDKLRAEWNFVYPCEKGLI